jgi:DNA polymerase-3 subunit gamma/tau
LNFVAEQEQVKLERGAAELIARAAAGGMRDALSLLDQAIAYSGQEIVLAQVQAMLGVADPRAIQKLVLHVAGLDSPGGLHLLHELAESGADLRQINAQVAEYWRALMLAKAGANVATILDRTEDELREILQMSQHFNLEELTECARIFAQNELVQKNQGTPQLGLELALLACVELHRRAHASQTVTTSPMSSLQPVQAVSPRALPVQEPPPVSAPSTRLQMPAEEEIRIPSASWVSPPQGVSSLQSQEPIEVLPDWDEVPSGDDDIESEPSPVHAVRPATETPTKSESTPSPIVQNASDAPPLTVQQVKDKWEQIKRRIRTKKDGVKVAPLLNDFAVFAVEGTAEQVVVVIRAAHDWHYKTLAEKERFEFVEWAMKLEFGMECRVRLVPPSQSMSSAPLPAPPPVRDSSNRSANTMSAAMPQQSAHREHAAAEQPPSALQKLNGSETGQRRDLEASTASVSGEEHIPPLAKTNSVRENTTKKPMPNTEESLRQKAVNDPVVQEVVRLFKAEIKDIHRK